MNVICMKWGNKFPVKYVNRLYAMASRTMDTKFGFVYFTENSIGIRPEVEIQNLPELELAPESPERDWRKLTVFKKDFGGLSIVGVRPLSQDFINRYPKHLQNLRIKIKPGFIPPYYADMPESFGEVIVSEEKYIRKKLELPFIIDWKYFLRAVFNILVRGNRSK